jgi:SAM-dependent methyltransferase
MTAVPPSIVLAAYAEPVISGRRVLVVGPASSGLALRLLERGARLVHVCDPDPVRLAEAGAKNREANVAFSALADGHFALREGAFDLAVVEDAGISDTLSLVGRVRRALAPRGVALIACPNAEARSPLLPHTPAPIALDYYALYDAVRREFQHVRMLGQAPFVGYVVAEFAPEREPEPSLDTAFVPGGAEEPELFLALASQYPAALDAFALIQLPLRAVMDAGGADPEQLRRARAAEQAAREQLRELSLETARQNVKLRQLEASLTERDAELASLREELERRNQELANQAAELAELEERARREAESDAAAHELAGFEAALSERGDTIRALERQLREAERIGRELVHELVPRNAELWALRPSQTIEKELVKSQADLVATRWALAQALRGQQPG